MRILTFLHSFEPGGVERVALRLVRQWRAMGVDAPLVIGREEGALQPELAAELDFHCPAPGPLARRFETFWMIWHLPALIRRLRPDVLFCAGNTYTVVAVVMKIILGRDCPPIVSKISNDLVLPGLFPPLTALYRLWAWLQTRFIEGWVAMHPAMGDDVRRLVEDGAVSIIPDPALTMAQVAALQSWRPSPAAVGRRFVAIGRLEPQKNYPLMLRAFARGARADDRLLIFGDGTLRPQLEQLAAQLGIADGLCFAGYVDDPWTAVSSEDILLLSSSYEGIPAVLLEAMTAGLTIVSTDSGPGVRGLLGGYAQASLCPPGDEAGFAAALATPVAARLPAVRFEPFAYTVEEGARRYLKAFAAVTVLAERAPVPSEPPLLPEPAFAATRAHPAVDERRRAAID